MRRREAAAAAGVTAFALFAIVAARHLTVGTLRAPGPGFFPLTLGSALLVVGVALIVRAIRGSADPGDQARAPLWTGAPWRSVLTLATLFAYVFVLDGLGFTVATALLLAVLFALVAPRRWPVAIAGGIVAAALSFVVFHVWLGVQLPVGPWAF